MLTPCFAELDSHAPLDDVEILTALDKVGGEACGAEVVGC